MMAEPRAIAFSVAGTPRPQPRPRFVKGRVVSTASPLAKLWRSAVEREAKQCRGETFSAAVEISMAFRFATKDRSRTGQPHTAKPDGDNLAKAVMDVLEAVGVLANDCRVARLVVEKRWADKAGVGVVVKECGNFDRRGTAERVDSVDGCCAPPEWLSRS